MIIKNYLNAVDNLIEEFYKTYYAEKGESIYGDEWHSIGIMEHGPGVIGIGDEFHDIGDIFTALNFKIPKKTFFAWHDYQLNFYMAKNEGNPINLYSWYKGKRIYTAEEKKADNEKINKSYEDLKNTINK